LGSTCAGESRYDADMELEACRAMPPGRAGLMCHNPKCWFLVHEDVAYGGFCCKWCHARHVTSSRTKKRQKQHGTLCAQMPAPEAAPRAPMVPPTNPLNGAGGGGDMSGDDSQQALHYQDSSFVPHVSHTHTRPEGLIGSEVRVCGFVEHAAFNGLIARTFRETGDGRYDLRLANGTILRWVKLENFEPVDPPPPPWPGFS